MNFFEHQEVARRASKRLVVLFALAVIAIVIAVNVVVGFLYLTIEAPHGAWQTHGLAALPSSLIALTSLVVVALIGGGTAYELLALREGGAAVAAMVGARPVDPSTRDLAERRLLNVVEEMALASGVAVPRAYVLDGQQAINAFAAGFSPGDAIVAVTRGTLARLTRDELQGVIAHEFSHILNGDMRLNLRLIGILHGLLVLALAGRVLMELGGRGRGSSGSRDGGAIAVLLVAGMATWILGYIGVFFGRLIKASVSRQREFLADASSVQFTRNPDGIGGALRKIGGLGGGGGIGRRIVAPQASSLPELVGSAHDLRAQGVAVDVEAGLGSQISHPHAETLSHLFIAPAQLAFASGWLSTHPPLEERIRRIYGRAVGFLPAPEQPWQPTSADTGGARGTVAELAPLEFRPAGEAAVLASPVAALVEGTAGAASDAVGAIGALQASARSFAQQVDAEPRTAAIENALVDTAAVQLLVLGMLIEKAQPFSGQQRQLVTEAFGAPAAQQVDALHEAMQQLPPGRRLLLLDRAMPTLLKLADGAGERLLMLCHALIVADGRITLPEFLLFTVLKRRLGRNARRAVPVRYRNVGERAIDAALVLSLLAELRLPERPEHPFNAGALLLPGVDTVRVDVAAIRLDEVTVALERLNQLAPLAKPVFIKACTATAFVDDMTNWKAASCLRTICTALDAPLPPRLLEGDEIASG